MWFGLSRKNGAVWDDVCALTIARGMALSVNLIKLRRLSHSPIDLFDGQANPKNSGTTFWFIGEPFVRAFFMPGGVV